jgi:hypothetical protein
MTPEDQMVWEALVGRLPLWVLHPFSQHDDRRDARQMLWIQRQAGYRAEHERRYGRGKPIRRLHPLARIGMGV